MKRDVIAEARARQVAVKVVSELQAERDALHTSLRAWHYLAEVAQQEKL